MATFVAVYGWRIGLRLWFARPVTRDRETGRRRGSFLAWLALLFQMARTSRDRSGL